MTVKEFGRFCKSLKIAYPDPKFLPDKEATTLWYEMLKDLSYAQADTALRQHICVSPYIPTIADIRKRASECADMEPLEAWAVVYKAICNSAYDSEKEFEKLPPICKKAVGRHENLREWATMDINTVQSVEQSHFIRAYNAALETARQEARISLDARTRLGASYQDKIEG